MLELLQFNPTQNGDGVMDTTEDFSSQERLDQLAKKIATQQRAIHGFNRMKNRRKSDELLRELYGEFVVQYEESINSMEQELASLEPAALKSPKHGFIGLLNKLLPAPAPESRMGRMRRANEAGFSRFHKKALQMMTLSIVIILAAHFINSWSTEGILTHMNRFLKENGGVGIWTSIIQGFAVVYLWNAWRGSVMKQKGAFYQGHYMFLTQWLYTGSESWSRVQRTKAHLAFTLWYSFLAVFYAPILIIVAFIASSQLMTVYLREFETTKSSIAAAQASAVVYKSYEISMVGALIGVYLVKFGIDLFI